MSDGTLRAFGVLVAPFQGAGNGEIGRRLVGIEEPEVALHPAAASVLRDSLHDASESAQILVTSHSPDLLDADSIPDGSTLTFSSGACVDSQGIRAVTALRSGRNALRR
jgi:predicted ATPase